MHRLWNIAGLLLTVTAPAAFGFTCRPSCGSGARLPHALAAAASSAEEESFSSSALDTATDKHSNYLPSWASGRLPTSVDDQVRQATDALQRQLADNEDGSSGMVVCHRHLIRLLLPIIGATDLDDWPGGARQMMEAAQPLVETMMQGLGVVEFADPVLLDASDGVYALVGRADVPANDICAVLLPTAEIVPEQLRRSLETQVGPQRNLLLINPQWKRRSDFGGRWNWNAIFSSNKQQDDDDATYIEKTYVPTFSMSNLVVEGEVIRVLRAYPGPWRVFGRDEDAETGEVSWLEYGQKEFVPEKPADWENDPRNQQDGGLLFSYGMPTYSDIVEMLNSAPNYRAKNPAERAMAAFNFIKDTL